MRAVFLICLLLGVPAAPAAAQGCDTHTGLPVPRFVSLKFNEVRGRSGPSFNHAVKWRYQRTGLPVEVIGETPDWRRVRDPEGEVVWMHRRTLTGRRAVWVKTDTRLHTRPDENASVIALVQTGAVLWELDATTEFTATTGETTRGGSFGGAAGPIIHQGELALSSGYGIYNHMAGNLLLVLSASPAASPH